MRQTVKHRHGEAGFTLVEVAIVIAIAGLMIGAYFAFLTPMTQQRNLQVTEQRMQKVADALSDFAQRNGRLPCTGTPNAAILGTQSAPCNVGNLEGIVPFRDLGLTQQEATDAWGDAFTYRVQQNALTAFNPAAPGAIQVHANARLDNTWFDTATALNMNPRKSVFCGRQITPAQRIIVNETIPPAAAAPVVPAQVIAPADMNVPDSSGGATPIVGAQLPYIAYVLISHGQNRERAFVWGQAARSPATASVQPSDNVNADNNLIFGILPRSDTPGANFYDDMVLWRTQFSTIRELGNDSCARA